MFILRGASTLPTLRVNPEKLADLVQSHEATSLVVCVLDLQEANDFIDLEFFGTGQDALDYLNRLDRPNANLVPVGLHLVLPPRLTGGSWKVEAVLDFTKISMEHASERSELYAYRISSGRYYSDNQQIETSSIRKVRSLFQASNANNQEDTEINNYQIWIANLLSQLISESAADKK